MGLIRERFSAMRFTVRKLNFGGRPGDAEDADRLPTPALVRSKARRALGIAQAAELLQHLPEPGESLHVVCTSRFDLSDVLNHLIDRHGTADRVVIATLGYNARNLKAMLRWLDAGVVKSLTLLASIFFRSHNGGLWDETLTEFRSRGQRAACCHCHAKVSTLAFADGTRLSIEGSANLCGNGSGREQFVMVNDAELCDWHAAWITELVGRHEQQANEGNESQDPAAR
jgi:hypothetical protein